MTPSSANVSTKNPFRSGSHFDPEMVSAFLDIHEEFRKIALEFADFQEEREALLK